jgi:AraC-like DNA-binding protein
LHGVFSTGDVAAKDRFSYWSDLVCSVFVNLDCRSPVAKSFNARMRLGSLAWLRIVEAESDAIEGVRSRHQISKGQEDDLLVSVQTSGQMRVVQDGRQTLVTPGNLVLCDSRRPYALQISEGSQSVWLQFPRQELLARIGSSSPFVAHAVSGWTGAGALFLALARALPNRIAEFGAFESPEIASHTLDLLALTLNGSIGVQSRVSSSGTITAQRLKLAIKRHLRDPALKPSHAAALGRITVRHANRLLAAEGISLERFIYSERLERCRAMLQDRKFDTLTISQIALSWGYNDLSHFSRTFRARYGLSPSEFRKHALANSVT